MNAPKPASILFPLFGLLVACGDPATPDADSASTDGSNTDSTTDAEDESSGSPASTGESPDDDTTGTQDDSTGSESGGDTDVQGDCTPPPLLSLDDIPDNPSLDYGGKNVVATFEVDGHDLIGKFVTDVAAAEGGLKLWQEFTLRIPENQLFDLVQLDIYLDNDPIAYFNRNGNVTTRRLGLKIGFSVDIFALNQDDPCAPLEPRRGTFDWSLVHEFGHLRGFVDESWPLFLDTFPDVQGPGDGYPEDGSPVLTGDFVTSYAERADGDEDYAESWTTYVMLPAGDIPAPTAGESLALQKVHWMDQQPDLRELREAIRITEADYVAVDVPAAPPLDPSVFDSGDTGIDDIVVPVALIGQWRESPSDGHVVTFASDDITLAQYEAGTKTESLSLGDAIAADAMHYFEIHGGSPTLAYSYIQTEDGDRFNHDFFLQEDGETVIFRRELLDAKTDELVFLPDVILTLVP
ncbi:MAG: hypothetical protein JKY37_08315 [Nannocystaceae bacterium]|nr:hypothetical protein [Nannocystaceae bacterium]